MEQEHKTVLELVHQARSAIIVMLGALLGIFAVQNMATVELTFLLWTFESRRIVVIGLSVVTGLVIGWIIGYSRGRKRNR